MEVFKLAGIEVEPLSKFAHHFHLALSPDLKNVWIGHKDTAKRKEVKSTGLKCRVELSVSHVELPPFSGDLKPFKPQKILHDIIISFKIKTLVSYIFKNCYILMRWENGSFELIADTDLNARLAAVMKIIRAKKRACPFNDPLTTVPSKKARKSPDIFEGDERALIEAKRKRTRWPRPIRVRNQLASAKVVIYPQETVLLDPILYNWKQLSQVLRVESEEELLLHIIHAPLTVPVAMLDEWERASSSWLQLRQILDSFVRNEAILSKNNGYGRLLKKHLKTSGCEDELKFIAKERVMSYICDIMRRVLPMDLFGNSNRLRKNFFAAVKELIFGAKFQRFSLQSFLECFEPYPKWRLQMAPLFQRLFTIKLVKFFVTEYILIILKNSFYITECGSSGFELFYFKKADIESMSVRKINELLKTGKIEEVKAQQICMERRWLENGWLPKGEVKTQTEDLMSEDCQYQLPTAKVRFLPKTCEREGSRMITIIQKVTERPDLYLFSGRDRKRKDDLAMVKRFLDCICGSIGTGIQPLHSNPQLAQVWNNVAQLKETIGGKVYFVKADITDAFGSVNHERLFHVLDLFCPDSKHRWTELSFREWVVRGGRLRNVNRTSFSRKLLRSRVLHTRQISQRERQPPSFMKNIIRQIVTLQLLRFGHKLYRVTSGLCQGAAGPLSTRLCDLYYSALDLTYFTPLTRGGDAVLLRGTDDYLFVTVNRSKAEQFYSTVVKGISNYGVMFSKKKLVTNLFDENPVFTYLGLKFNVETLTVEPSYERYKTESMLNYVRLSISGLDPSMKTESFMKQRNLNLNVLKFEPIVLKNKYSDLRHFRRVLCDGCIIQARKSLALALYLRPSLELLTLAVTKAGTKLARVVHRHSILVPVQEILYVYWQCVYSVFHRYSGNFKGFTKIVQFKLIRFVKNLRKQEIMFEIVHSDIEEAFQNSNVQWWRSWQ